MTGFGVGDAAKDIPRLVLELASGFSVLCDLGWASPERANYSRARHVTDARYVSDFPMTEQRELISVLEVAPDALRSLAQGASWEPVILRKEEVAQR